LSLNPRSPLLWYSKALAHFAVGELKEDIESLEQASRCCSKALECSTHPIAQFWNDWGITLMKLSELTHDQSTLESALDKFERAFNSKEIGEILLNPDLILLYHYGCALDFLGDFTSSARDYERAVQVLSHVVRQDPTYAHARYNLAIALSHLGEASSDVESFHKSLEHFHVILNRDSEDGIAWNECGLALLNLAQLSEGDYDPEKTKFYYDQAEEKFVYSLSMGESIAAYHLACLYSLTRNFAASMHFIEKAQSANVLPPIDDLLHDEWLEGVRSTDDFRSFITLLSQRHEERM